MTFEEWFEANKKYIYGADVDAWCETAFEAGRAAGLQERAPVDMEPVAWMERQMLNTGWSDWYHRTPRRKNDPLEIRVSGFECVYPRRNPV